MISHMEGPDHAAENVTDLTKKEDRVVDHVIGTEMNDDFTGRDPDLVNKQKIDEIADLEAGRDQGKDHTVAQDLVRPVLKREGHEIPSLRIRENQTRHLQEIHFTEM